MSTPSASISVSIVFIALGHSWGALLAMEYAIRHRDRVSHLVLVNAAPASAVYAARVPPVTARLVATRRDSCAGHTRVESALPVRRPRGDADYHRVHFAHALRRPELLEPLVQRLRRNATAEVIRTSRLIERGLYDQTWSRPAYDLGPKLRTLDVPTLIVHGDHDFIPVDVAQLCPRGVAELAACNCRGVRSLRVPRAPRDLPQRGERIP